ncbi:antibiotic biosynthesis monooxygenase [Schlesneria sp. DSM 10557]|uniref:antibiotic biosynthesis monooxygenase n=2 Tax=unclassified Schlesneria TaxID=2762017 RepID=UPI002F142631
MMSESKIKPADTITVLVTRRIRDGGDDAFEDALKQWIPRLTRFPGHLGVQMLRPLQGDREYGAVITFRSTQDWEAFQQSSDYRQFLEEIKPLLDTNPGFVTANGLESWFLPPEDRGASLPPRWKMAIVTWMGVSFTVYTVTTLLAPYLSNWPWLPRFLLSNACVVSVLTWCVMPALTSVFRSWLSPRT